MSSFLAAFDGGVSFIRVSIHQITYHFQGIMNVLVFFLQVSLTSHLSQAFCVLSVFKSTAYQSFPSKVLSGVPLSPMPTDPQCLSRGAPLLLEAFENKVKGAIHEGIKTNSLTEITNNNHTSTYHTSTNCGLSSPAAWQLDPASDASSTSLASLHERKSSTKSPIFIFQSRSTLHQLLRFSSSLPF